MRLLGFACHTVTIARSNRDVKIHTMGMQQVLMQSPKIRLSFHNYAIIIPYETVERDGKVFRYHSLIKNPRAIDEIPELAAEPMMKNLVARINSKVNGLYETVRLDHTFGTTRSAPGEWEFMIGIIFRDRSLFADYLSHVVFAGHFLISLQRYWLATSHHNPTMPPEWQTPTFVIAPAILQEEKKTGWIIDLWMKYLGNSEAEAHRLFELDLRFLFGFLDLEREALPFPAPTNAHQLEPEAPAAG